MAEKWVICYTTESGGRYIAHAMLDRPADTPTGRKLVADFTVFDHDTPEAAVAEARRRIELMGGTVDFGHFFKHETGEEAT
jgi:hypothetical protein